MFRKIHQKNVVKLILWVLAVVVVFSFAFSGIFRIASDRVSLKYAGNIFGKNITLQEYFKNMNAVKIFMFLKDRDLFNKIKTIHDINPLTWKRIILLTEAKKRKIRVSDEEVVEAIKNIFTNDEQTFDIEIYKLFIKENLRITQRQFEEVVREALIIEKLHNSIISEVEITGQELEQRYKKGNQKTSIDYIQINQEDFLGRVKPITDDEMKKYYEENKDKFKNLLQINIQYAGMDFAIDTKEDEKESSMTCDL